MKASLEFDLADPVEQRTYAIVHAAPALAKVLNSILLLVINRQSQGSETRDLAEIRSLIVNSEAFHFVEPRGVK